MPSLLFCGPKLAACGIVLSIWGVIMLAMLGIFFSAKSAVLIEDVPFTEEDIINEHFLQLFRRDPEAFPGQPRDIVSPVCPGSSPGPLPGGACPEHLPRETSRMHLKQMPEPPQLSPFDVEEQRLYSELLPGDRAPYPISKGAPCHPTEEVHFGHLYPGSYPFGHDPELMTIEHSFLSHTHSKNPPQAIYSLYNQVAINCFIAAAVYVGVGAISLCQVRLNKRQEYMVT
ncbi:hypothetical protein QTP86_025158 [Hemibagrus guttatus]|nr:hypothetical protein QTP86_025158 [Hemibagrus guttatus]